MIVTARTNEEIEPMALRIYYLRDNVNVRRKDDGSMSRGNPVACVVTSVNRENGTIRYAVSTLHPPYMEDGKLITPHFDRELSKKIASGRLAKKPLVLQGIPGSGHEITMKVMQHIAANTTAVTLRSLAQEWVRTASVPRPLRDAVTAEAAHIEALVRESHKLHA